MLQSLTDGHSNINLEIQLPGWYLCICPFGFGGAAGWPQLEKPLAPCRIGTTGARTDMVVAKGIQV